MKTQHLIPHQSVLCQDPRNIGRILKIMYCWDICLEALCSVLRSEPWSRHREARQRDYGKKPPGPVSVLGHDYHFKIEVGLPTCTGKCEDGSHSVLGNPRRGWRSVWVSVFKFHRKSQKLLHPNSIVYLQIHIVCLRWKLVRCLSGWIEFWNDILSVGWMTSDGCVPLTWPWQSQDHNFEICVTWVCDIRPWYH